MNIHEVLLRPMITEKSTIMADMGKYSFRVAPKANKIEIKEAVQKTFGVTVEDVNITKLKGKVKPLRPPLQEASRHQEGCGHTEVGRQNPAD